MAECVASTLPTTADTDVTARGAQSSSSSSSNEIGTFFWTSNRPGTWRSEALDRHVVALNLTEWLPADHLDAEDERERTSCEQQQLAFAARHSAFAQRVALKNAYTERAAFAACHSAFAQRAALKRAYTERAAFASTASEPLSDHGMPPLEDVDE